MRVSRKEQTLKTVRFEELKLGDAFYIAGLEGVFVKASCPAALGAVNCFRIRLDGAAVAAALLDGAIVQPLNSELVVWRAL